VRPLQLAPEGVGGDRRCMQYLGNGFRRSWTINMSVRMQTTGLIWSLQDSLLPYLRICSR
jgi:hypothetical protein